MQSYRKNVLLVVCVIVLTAISCNMSAAGSQPTATVAVVLPVTGDTPVASTDTPVPTATSSAVTITVAHDSLSIRRGPTTYYDVLAYFKVGETATATARNSDGSWLYIPIPATPSVSGWVSAATDYSTTTGDISTLPVMNVAPPVPAYIRNCTFHPQLVQPGNVLLKPQTDSSGRIAHFAPGIYTVYDQNAMGHPKILTVTLTEGDSVDINKDGEGNTYYCP